MARYVVMVPPPDAPATDARIVRDGFTLLGFLFPPLWLLWHRLWLATVLAFAAMFALSLLAETAGFKLVAPLLSLLVSLFVGLEGRAMILSALARRGWTEAAAIEADSLADAEIRYAFAFAEPNTKSIEVPPAPRRAGPVRPASGPALGMLSYPGHG
jgi:Protein of unknown function (DUF2628).